MDESLITDLKPTELSALMFLAKGCTNKQIAEILSLSKKTVEHMLGNYDVRRAIYSKIGVTNRAQAAAWYIENFGLPESDTHEVMSPHELVDIVASSPYFLAQITDTLSMICKVRLQGNPYLAIELANTTVSRVEEVISSTSSADRCRPLYRSLALIMLEQGKAYREVSARESVLPIAEKIARKVRLIAKACNDKDLWALADCYIADAYYILGDAYITRTRGSTNVGRADFTTEAVKCLTTSVHYLTRALTSLNSIDNQLWALRTLAISWAYLDESEQFETIANRAKSIIGAGIFSQIDQACSMLEGIARGYRILGNWEASFVGLEAAKKIYIMLEDNNEQAPFLATQQSRTHFELILGASPLDKAELEKVGKDTIDIADRHKYQRHSHYISNLLSRCL